MPPIDIRKLERLIDRLEKVIDQFNSDAPMPDYEKYIDQINEINRQIGSYAVLKCDKVLSQHLGIIVVLENLYKYFTGMLDLDPRLTWVMGRYLYYAVKDIKKKLR